MKKNRIMGRIAAILCVAMIVVGLVGAFLARSDARGTLGKRALSAQEAYATVSAHQKAYEKTAPATIKKAGTSLKAAEQAEKDAQTALDNLQALSAAIEAGESCGNADVDSLRSAIAAAETVDANLQAVVDGMLLDLYEGIAQKAYASISDAEKKAVTTQSSIAEVFSAIDIAYAPTEIAATGTPAIISVEDCMTAAQAAIQRAAELSAIASTLSAEADSALAQAKTVRDADSIDFLSRSIVFVQTNWIGLLFTAFLLLVASAILFLCADDFVRLWKENAVFSTAIALFVMVVIQTYALGFRFESIPAWLSYWYVNAMNVLRANSSVGMIALGMTLVIISGGIDLAVGSTLAGVSTVIMCLIDVGPKGILSNMGITGLPSYLIACGVGIVAGILFGAFTGTVITKGKVPPFIVTLGTMQIIRSVAQYFTKSYNPEVPKDFQILANATIGGQMLLPIVYWLVLALLFYVISKHTAFGRHVYAIGSNERTTMLSGINVDKVKMKVYILMGFVVALASIVQVARLRGVDVASAGSGYEMNAIAAVVVGGTSMSGGKGSIIGTVLGVLIIGIMNNLLVLLSVDSFLSSAFTGAIVIAAVLMQRKEKNA